MIIKGRTHDNADKLSRYLLRVKEGEKARVYEMRDTASDILIDALTDWELCGRTLSKGQKIMYHTHIRLPKGERMNDAQWMQTIEELEQRLQLTNCPRAIIEHTVNDDKAERHFHVAWSRFDPVTERCAPLSWDAKHHHETARWAEKEHGLTPVASLPDWSKGKRNPRQQDDELKAFKDRGIHKAQLQIILKYAWESSRNGAEFQDAIRAAGYDIERGERRDYVLNIDGLKVNPVKQLQNAGVEVKAQDFRELMRDTAVKRASDGSAPQQATERKPALMPVGKLSTAASMRKAKHLIKETAYKAINDQPEKAAKPAAPGFNRTKRRRNSKGPTLKPPGWMRGPT